MEADDRQLIAETLDGVRSAFEALLARHGPILWAAVRRQVADREEARDLYQEAVVRGYERLARLRQPERLRSWWLSIALNLVRSSARKRTPEPMAEVPELAPEAGVHPADGLVAAEDLERLRVELELLPERQREVCRLRLVDGLEHAEIATLLGITADASRANAYQALKRLRERLAE